MNKRDFQYLVQDRMRGKMAEVIFEEMFKMGGYTVMFNGYERNLEYLVQARGVFKCDKKLGTFGSAPDFLIIGRKNYYFVEVKYRTYLKPAELLRLAISLYKLYPHCRLFVVHPRPPFFFYNSVERIISNHGRIDAMDPIELGVKKEYIDCCTMALTWVLRADVEKAKGMLDEM